MQHLLYSTKGPAAGIVVLYRLLSRRQMHQRPWKETMCSGSEAYQCCLVSMGQQCAHLNPKIGLWGIRIQTLEGRGTVLKWPV